jgi:hypothetical protein
MASLHFWKRLASIFKAPRDRAKKEGNVAKIAGGNVKAAVIVTSNVKAHPVPIENTRPTGQKIRMLNESARVIPERRTVNPAVENVTSIASITLSSTVAGSSSSASNISDL